MNPLPPPWRDPDRPPWLRPTAAYVHIPFCRHHCGYCDFAVAVGRDDLMEAYLQALAAELARLEEPYPVATLFLGGGTPSYLPAPMLDRLLGLLHRWLPLEEGGEYSLEGNPESLDEEKVDLLAAHGVNRLSLGAQSFRPEILRILERPHDPGDIHRALALVRDRIPLLSLDLIFGVPGQSSTDWLEDLRQGLDTEAGHLATYGLTFEKGTPLWKRRTAGLLDSLPEEAERGLYETAITYLEQAGFRHYELSNFARPGSACRHNRTYWANHAYLGFGMGAASYVGGARRLNVRSLDGYLRRTREDRPTWFQEERLEPVDRALETAALQLRRAEGIEHADFRRQTGFDLDDLLGPTFDHIAALGLLEMNASAVRLTLRGKCVADAIIGEMYRRSLPGAASS